MATLPLVLDRLRYEVYEANRGRDAVPTVTSGYSVLKDGAVLQIHDFAHTRCRPGQWPRYDYAEL